jgi:hypothetical protein
LSDAHPYLASHTSDVIAQLGSLQTGGDRTVAAAIAGTHFGSPERNDVILLITSGDDACSASLVDAVRARRAEQIQTVVVGFGPSATDLDAAAVAGGFAHTCPMGTDAECGPNGTCQASGGGDHAAYVARDQAELTDALMSLTSMPTGTDTLCSYTLETTAANADRIQVYVGGQQLQQGIDTWSFSPTAVPQTVIFQGATCDKLRESTSMSPVQLEVVVDDRP